MIAADMDRIAREALSLVETLHHGSPIIGETEAQMWKLHGLLGEALDKSLSDWLAPVDVHPRQEKPKLGVAAGGGALKIDVPSLIPWGFLDDLPTAPPPLSYGIPVVSHYSDGDEPFKEEKLAAVGPYGANWGSSSPTVTKHSVTIHPTHTKIDVRLTACLLCGAEFEALGEPCSSPENPPAHQQEIERKVRIATSPDSWAVVTEWPSGGIAVAAKHGVAVHPTHAKIHDRLPLCLRCGASNEVLGDPCLATEKESDPGYVITKSENGAVTSKRFKVKHKKPDRSSPFPPGLIGW